MELNVCGSNAGEEQSKCSNLPEKQKPSSFAPRIRSCGNHQGGIGEAAAARPGLLPLPTLQSLWAVTQTARTAASSSLSGSIYVGHGLDKREELGQADSPASPVLPKAEPECVNEA